MASGFELDNKDTNFHGLTTYDDNSNNVLVIMKKSNSWKTIIHELKHCYQFEIGNISFRKNDIGQIIPGILYDYFDEIEAHRRGELIGSSSIDSTTYQS